MTDTSIRVVLADDHPVVLSGVQEWIAREPGMTIVGMCTDGDSAVAAVRGQRPDVLILDLRMGPRSGLDVIKQLRDQPTTRIVVLTAAIKDAEVIEAMRLGASGLVLKESAPETLVSCIRKVHRGEQWIDRETAARAFGTAIGRFGASPGREETLTPRETEIVQMVALGLRNKAIAQRLSISEGTVKVHLHNVYEKLGVDGRFKLIEAANRRGIV